MGASSGASFPLLAEEERMTLFIEIMFVIAIAALAVAYTS